MVGGLPPPSFLNRRAEPDLLPQLQTLLIMVVNTGEFCHYGYSLLLGVAMIIMNILDRRPR